MKYELLVDYTTGDSFGSEEVTEEEMGVIFENLEVAKLALEMVKEHYSFYNQFEDAWYKSSPHSRNNPEEKTREDICELVKTKPWSTKRLEEYLICLDAWKYSITLPVDDKGNTQSVSVPYTGYFETLRKAYVRPVGDELSVIF